MNIPLKPGKTTTEFWGTVSAAGILFALTVLDQIDGDVAAIGGTLLVALYNSQRAKLKKIQAEAEAAVLKQPAATTPGSLPPDAAQ